VTATELSPFALGRTWEDTNFGALILYTPLPATLATTICSQLFIKREDKIIVATQCTFSYC